MVLPNIGSFIADVGDVLEELLIDEGTIKQILGALEDGASSMPRESEIKPIPDGAFSALPAGKEMGFHTNNAQTYLLDVFTEMMDILTSYRDGVVAYKSGSTTTDEFTQAELLQINHAAAQGNQFNGQDVPGQGGGR